jgi:hypothetical protein
MAGRHEIVQILEMIKVFEVSTSSAVSTYLSFIRDDFS